MRIVVSGYETLNSSVNANPRFRLYTNEGVFLTSSDIADAYGLFNGWKHYRETGRTAEVELTRANRIRRIKWVDQNELTKEKTS